MRRISLLQIFFCAILFFLFFRYNSARAAVVLDNLSGVPLSTQSINCKALYDSGNESAIINDLNCIVWRQSFGVSSTTKPFVSLGKLKSITLITFSDSRFCSGVAEDRLMIQIDDAQGVRYVGTSDVTRETFLSYGHEYTPIKFNFGTSTIDFSSTTIKTLYTAEGNCPFIVAQTENDSILPSTYPDGNVIYKYCSIYGCAWGAPLPPPDTLHDVMMIIETTDDSPPPPPLPGKTPVLIVPGILGTELWNGVDHIWADLQQMAGDVNDQFISEKLSLDNNGNTIQSISLGSLIEKIFRLPIFDVDIFESLRLELEESDYILDQKLFYFPYDWRLNLDESKEKLNQKVEAIKLQTGATKVDVIAHSMGGLLVKGYLNSYGKSSVDKLIFVGTPHIGAPKAGKVLLEGDRFDIYWLEEDRMRDIALNSPALHQLLPSPTYFNHYQGYIKSYNIFPDLPPFYSYQQTEDFFINQKNKNPLMFQMANNFFDKHLENMDFTGIDTYNIAGCKNSTQTGYQVNASGNINRVGYSSGDETVPLVSGDYVNIPALHKYYVKGAKHSELPSTNGVRELILDILNGQAPALAGNVSGSSSFCGFKGKTLSWHSPVEVHVYSQGLHTGPIENNGIEYGVPGVDYDIIGNKKFIFLPTDEGQTYQIKALGEALGTFDLLVSENDNGTAGRTFVFNDVPISTSTPISLDISETSPDNQILVNGQTVSANAQVIGDGDLTPPQTAASISGTGGNNGWYRSDVRVSLSATDDSSGVLGTYYKLAAGDSYQVCPPPLPSPPGGGNCALDITTEGSHTLQFYSVDNAGNNEILQSIQINIDKTPPEFKLSFSLSANDFVFESGDSDVSPQCSAKECVAEDRAGNRSKISFQKVKLFNLRSLSLKQIEQNGQTSAFPDNLLVVNNLNLNGQLRDFNQTIAVKKQELGRVDYVKKKDISNITELTKQGIKRYGLPGVRYLQIETLGNTLKTGVN